MGDMFINTTNNVNYKPNSREINPKIIKNKAGHTVVLFNYKNEPDLGRIATEYDKNGKPLLTTAFHKQGGSCTEILSGPRKDTQYYRNKDGEINFINDAMRGISYSVNSNGKPVNVVPYKPE